MSAKATSSQSARRSPTDRARRLADAHAAGSLSNRLRERRQKEFERLVEATRTQAGTPVRILDIGGTNSFWEQRGWGDREDVEIAIVNLEREQRRFSNIEPMVGDATDLGELETLSYDIVFSNSVIEHLRTFTAQRSMAREVRRLAPRYWVQTPNYWFPVEPHFLTPGWHYLPEGVRVWLLQRRQWGWRGPCSDPEAARGLVQEIRLLRGSELQRLFPDAELIAERVGPLVKSFVAVRRATSTAGASDARPSTRADAAGVTSSGD